MAPVVAPCRLLGSSLPAAPAAVSSPPLSGCAPAASSLSGARAGRLAAVARNGAFFALASLTGNLIGRNLKRRWRQGSRLGRRSLNQLLLPSTIFQKDVDELTDDEGLDAEEVEGCEFSMVPGLDSVEAKPIYVISDGTGHEAQRLAETNWAQFGSAAEALIRLRPLVLSEAEADKVVMEAYMAAESGALVVSTVSNVALNAHISSECARLGLPHVDTLQPMLHVLRERFSIAAPEKKGAVFVVSDGTGDSAFNITRTALQQFPDHGIEDVTVSPNVRTLEDISHIVMEATRSNALVVFTFASQGASRFMRRQCELAGLRYADLCQPLLVEMEFYLNYSAFGVARGFNPQPVFEKRKL